VIGQYVIFAAINVGIGVIAWRLWDDISSWFDVDRYEEFIEDRDLAESA